MILWPLSEMMSYVDLNRNDRFLELKHYGHLIHLIFDMQMSCFNECQAIFICHYVLISIIFSINIDEQLIFHISNLTILRSSIYNSPNKNWPLSKIFVHTKLGISWVDGVGVYNVLVVWFGCCWRSNGFGI